jgi:hypothetical protein
MKHFLYTLLILAFFPFAFCGLLFVTLLSGVGGVMHIIRYDLIPLYRKLYSRQQKDSTRDRPSQILLNVPFKKSQ